MRIYNYNSYINESRKPKIYKIKMDGIFYHGTTLRDDDTEIFDEPSVRHGDYDAVWFTDEEHIAEEFADNWGEDNTCVIYRVKIKENKIADIPYHTFTDLLEYYDKSDLREIIPMLNDMGFNGWKTIGSIGHEQYEDYALFNTDNINVLEVKLLLNGKWTDYMSIDDANKIIEKKYITESNSDFLKWKRKNVTLRGIQDTSMDGENNGMAKYGQGLYTAFLSNKSLAKQYGDVHYVVNAIPKNPKIVYSTNEAEIFLQELVTKYCKANNVPRDNWYFSEHTTIADEMLKLGYDGLVIKGREMVNYKPENIRYFRTEAELENYYNRISNINEAVRLHNTVFNEFSFVVINNIGHLKLGLKGQNDQVTTIYFETYGNKGNLFKISYPDDIELTYKEYMDNNFDDFTMDIIKLINKNILGYRFDLNESVKPKYTKPYSIIEYKGDGKLALSDFEKIFTSMKEKNKYNKDFWIKTIK